jgi:biotin operon repressor
MPTKRKAKAAPAKPETKKAQVRYMLIRDHMSVAQIAEKMGIGRTAAYSLIADLKRDGIKIDAHIENGTMVYQVKAEWSPEDLEARAKRTRRAAKPFGKKHGC